MFSRIWTKEWSCIVLCVATKKTKHITTSQSSFCLTFFYCPCRRKVKKCSKCIKMLNKSLLESNWFSLLYQGWMTYNCFIIAPYEKLWRSSKELYPPGTNLIVKGNSIIEGKKWTPTYKISQDFEIPVQNSHFKTFDCCICYLHCLCIGNLNCKIYFKIAHAFNNEIECYT